MSELPDVAGPLDCSLARLEYRARVRLQEEQQRASPDNHLIALLCDTVRVTREYCNYVDGKGIRPLIEGDRER